MIHSLSRSLGVILLPTLEFFFLRYFTREIAHLRWGWVGFTDYDFILPAFLAALLFFSVLDREIPIRLCFQNRPTLFHILCFLSFGILSLSMDIWAVRFPALSVVAWIVLASATLISGLFVAMNSAYPMSHPRRWAIVPCILMALTVIFYLHLYEQTLWMRPLVNWTSQLTSLLLVFIFSSTISVHHNLPKERVEITHPDFSVAIGAPCAGLEGFILFLCFFALLMLIHSGRLRWYQWGALLISGLPIMFLLNVLRIFALFILFVGASQLIGEDAVRQVCIRVFHAHLGWIIYMGGLLTLGFALGFLGGKKSQRGSGSHYLGLDQIRST